MLSLSSLFKRTADEINLIKGKAKSYMINSLCAISVLSLIGLTFYPNYFSEVSRSIKLVDNLLFPIMMLSTLFLSMILYKELAGINSQIEKEETEDIDYKFYFIMLMGLQTFICKFIKIILNLI